MYAFDNGLREKKPTADHGNISKDATKRVKQMTPQNLSISAKDNNTVVGLTSHCQALTSAQPCAHTALMLSWLALFVV